MTSSNCCFLTCIQISQEVVQVVWYPHLLKNFPQFIVIHTVKGFGIVNKAEINAFLELSCFFDDPADVGNLISGSSAFFKSSLNIWKFTVRILLKPGLENFEHYFASMWDECNCAVGWAFFDIAFLWDWKHEGQDLIHFCYSSSFLINGNIIIWARSRKQSYKNILGERVFSAEGTASAKALRKEHLWFIQGPSKKPECAQDMRQEMRRVGQSWRWSPLGLLQLLKFLLFF